MRASCTRAQHLYASNTHSEKLSNPPPPPPRPGKIFPLLVHSVTQSYQAATRLDQEFHTNSTNQLTLNNIKGLVNNSQTASAICKRRHWGNKLHRRLNSTDQFINKTALVDLHGGQNISESLQDPDFSSATLWNVSPPR